MRTQATNPRSLINVTVTTDLLIKTIQRFSGKVEVPVPFKNGATHVYAEKGDLVRALSQSPTITAPLKVTNVFTSGTVNIMTLNVR